jgi:hypothetical protein
MTSLDLPQRLPQGTNAREVCKAQRIDRGLILAGCRPKKGKCWLLKAVLQDVLCRR